MCGTCFAQVPMYNMDRVENLKALYLKGDKKVTAVVEQMKKEAEIILQAPLMSVAEKTTLPPSKDKRDYMTQSPYWWADPDSPDGLPYIRHDGETNPEVYNFPERENSIKLGEYTQLLGILYYLTRQEEYAEKCAAFIRTWFLDPSLGMNPNMTYAQAVPGMVNIRGTGIVDSRRFLVSFGAVPFIKSSPSWTEEDDLELKEWCRTFKYWLDHSVNGRMENLQGNNHGLWYETARIIAMSVYEDPDALVEDIKNHLAPRLATQINEDGTLPYELVRTKSLHYSTFALEALILCDHISNNAGFSLWKYKTYNNKTMSLAVDFLVPYYLHPEKWPYEQIEPFEAEIYRAAIVLFEGGSALNRKDWLKTAGKIGYNRDKVTIDSLLYYDL